MFTKSKKCIYCGVKIKSKKLSAEKMLNDRELNLFKKLRDRNSVCQDCQTDLFLLQLS